MTTARALRLVPLFLVLLMPRPAARPFASDVKLYVFVAKAAANLYRDKSRRRAQSSSNAGRLHPGTWH